MGASTKEHFVLLDLLSQYSAVQSVYLAVFSGSIAQNHVSKMWSSVRALAKKNYTQLRRLFVCEIDSILKCYLSAADKLDFWYLYKSQWEKRNQVFQTKKIVILYLLKWCVLEKRTEKKINE